MYRGTTPTFVIELPQETAVSDITVAYLTFKQNGSVIIDKALEDMTLNVQDNTLEIVLTQAETLSFVSGAQVQYQLRFGIGGSYYATRAWTIPAEAILKDGMI